jgi:uncharacterized membrane protein
MANRARRVAAAAQHLPLSGHLGQKEHPLRVSRLKNDLGASLWFVPVLCVLVGAAISFGTIAIDRAFDYEAIPSYLVGDPNAVTVILSTIAASMVSLFTLVLTITMVVVQLAMGQFSPRIVQRILRDKPSQLAIGLFIATFVHAILTVREVTNAGDGTGHVPGIAVVTSFGLVFLSIVVLVLYVHHIGRALRVSELIELVGRDTRKLIDRTYPTPMAVAEPDLTVIAATRSGVVTSIEYEEIVAEAERASCLLELAPALGDFVPTDAPLFRVTGDAGLVNPDALRDAVRLDDERTLDEDVAYGLRLLVDIAERSLASPFEDPTTAVQAIDRLHDLLRQIATRPIPDGRYAGPTGRLRLVVPTMTWEAYVHLAFDEIRMAGAGSPQVSRRLMAALVDLKTVVPPDRVAVLDEEARLLSDAVAASHDDDGDAARATQGDAVGIGTQADV